MKSPTPARAALRLTLAALVAAGAAGCIPKDFHIGGENTVEAENSRLRASDAQLRKEVEALQARLKASEVENAALRRNTSGKAMADGAAMPMAATLELDGLSGPVCVSKDASIHAVEKGLADTLRLYATPYDQEHRLIPVAGRARARVLSADGKTELAKQAWDIKTFAGAWRDNLTGTYYRLEMPLPKGLPAAWKVELEVEDMATGVVLKAGEKFPR